MTYDLKEVINEEAFNEPNIPTFAISIFRTFMPFRIAA
jgi:hypothetical protein